MAPMDPDRLASVARKHDIELLVQFGSSATGRMHPLSDLDLAVAASRVSETFEAQADLIADLQALVPDREVDVVFINRADPLLLKRITERCVLLYGSPRRFQELKMYAFRRYQDHRRYLAMERDYVDRRLRAARR